MDDTHSNTTDSTDSSTDDFTVTPQDVSGDIDYRKLTKCFGADTLTAESSSDDSPTIHLTDDRETVQKKMGQAYSGGRTSPDAHREHGGDPEVDVAFQLLWCFFEPDDETVERLAREYRAGELLSGDLKARAAELISDFLEAHQARRPSGDELDDALSPYRLTDDERKRALGAVGFTPKDSAIE